MRAARSTYHAPRAGLRFAVLLWPVAALADPPAVRLQLGHALWCTGESHLSLQLTNDTAAPIAAPVAAEPGCAHVRGARWAGAITLSLDLGDYAVHQEAEPQPDARPSLLYPGESRTFWYPVGPTRLGDARLLASVQLSVGPADGSGGWSAEVASEPMWLERVTAECAVLRPVSGSDGARAGVGPRGRAPRPEGAR
jgi:hypothetical protein